jgi:hypothetical protein
LSELRDELLLDLDLAFDFAFDFFVFFDFFTDFFLDFFFMDFFFIAFLVIDLSFFAPAQISSEVLAKRDILFYSKEFCRSSTILKCRDDFARSIGLVL